MRLRCTWLCARLGLGLALLVALAGSPARAEDRVAARDHYKKAMLHYKLSEYRQALEEFKEAFRNFEEPSMLFNVGQCHRQLGQKSEAIRFYRAYLRDVPNATNREEVRKLIAGLEESLQKDREAEAAAAKAKAEAEAARNRPVENTVVATPPTKKPIHKQWWLWTTVGLVVVGVGVGVGLGLGLPHGTPSATTQGGTFEPFK